MKNKEPVRIGISTCPNDTFAFAGLLTGQTETYGIDFQFQLMDIDELNRSMFSGSLDVGKASFFAALKLADRMLVLPSGSALGFGVGPLLLAAEDGWQQSGLNEIDWPRNITVLSPGEYTTATLLLRIFYASLLNSQSVRLEQVLFSEIMRRLKSKQADLGVCIHEGRFTWQSQGLFLVEDLGQRWEKKTGLPLPLGGILANRNLPVGLLDRINVAIKSSLEWACDAPEKALPTMRLYAQEFSDQVLMEHVRLYVNDWTHDLGEDGVKSLSRFRELAIQHQAIPVDTARLEVLGRK